MMDLVPEPDQHDDMHWLRPLLSGVFQIDDITSGLAEGKALRIRGHLLRPASEVYERLAPEFARHQRTLLLRRQGDQDVIVSLAWVNQVKPDKNWLAVVLGILTVISVLATYMLNYVMQEWTWTSFLEGIGEGLQFALGLLGILVAHEMGHYLVARRFGVPVSPPYLIPLPLSPFGTMGAVIRMKGILPTGALCC